MLKQCAASCAAHEERETCVEKLSNITSKAAELHAQVAQLQSEVADAKKPEQQHAASPQMVELEERVQQLEADLKAAKLAESAAVNKSQASEAQANQSRSVLESAAKSQAAAIEKSQSLELETTNLRIELENARAESPRPHTLELEEQMKEKEAELLTATALNEVLQSQIAELQANGASARLAQLEAEHAQAKSAMSEEAVNKTMSYDKPFQLDADLVKHQIMGGVTTIQSACGVKMDGKDELKALKADKGNLQKEVAELRRGCLSDGKEVEVSANPRVTELEADVKQLKRLLASATAAEEAATNESHSLETRLLELESAMQARLSTENLNEANDTDAWMHAYELLLDLPDLLRNYVRDLPENVANFTRAAVQDLMQATIEAAPLIKDSMILKVIEVSQSSRAAFAAAVEMGQELTADWQRRAKFLLLPDAMNVDTLKHAMKQILSAQPHNVVIHFCLLHVGVILCFLVGRRLCCACSRRSNSAVVASEPIDASETETLPCKDADTTGSTTLADSRARRRELQEERTLEALQLVGVKPGLRVNVRPVDAASVSGEQSIVSLPVPMRERKRPPPLLHLDADSDADEDAPEVPRMKANSLRKAEEADQATVSRKWSWICVALAICIACLSCAGFLTCTGHLPLSPAKSMLWRAQLSGLLTACDKYSARAVTAAIAQAKITSRLVQDSATSSWESLGQMSAHAHQVCSQAARSTQTAINHRWVEVLAQIHTLDASHRNTAVAASFISLLAFLLAVCFVRRQRVPKPQAAPIGYPKEHVGDEHIDDGDVLKEPEDNEEKVLSPIQEIAEPCPTFDMAADDEETEALAPDAADGKLGPTKVTFGRVIKWCLLFASCLFGLVSLWLHFSGAQDKGQLIPDVTTGMLSHLQAFIAVLQTTISVQKGKIALEALQDVGLGKVAEVAGNVSLQARSVMEAAGVATYLEQVPASLHMPCQILAALAIIAAAFCALNRIRSASKRGPTTCGAWQVTGKTQEVLDDGAGMVMKSPTFPNDSFLI